jgi:hypothetical protein
MPASPMSSGQYKVFPYVPHNEYVERNQRYFHKPLPPQPTPPIIALHQTHSEKQTWTNLAPPGDFLQPVVPVYDRRARQQYLPVGAPPLATAGLSPSPHNGSAKSSHNLSPMSFAPPTPRRTSMQIVHSGLKSSFSDVSLVPHPRLVVKIRELLTKYIIEWWLIEILSWLFSAVCFCTIIGVLFFYDGRALPQWPLGLTLNGFISVFSGFAKSALLLPTCEAVGQLKWNWFRKEPRSLIDFEIMDAASRGPWGSFLLLMRALREKGL